MEYSIFEKNRNINFVGLAGAYGYLLDHEDKVLCDEIPFDEDFLQDFISGDGVYKRLSGGAEKKESILAELESENNPLLDWEDGEVLVRLLETVRSENNDVLVEVDGSAKRFRIPYTKEEVMYLKLMSDTGMFGFYFDEHEAEQIKKNISKYLKACGIDEEKEARCFHEFFHNPGESKKKEKIDRATRNEYNFIIPVIFKQIKANRLSVRSSFAYVSTFGGECVKHNAVPLEIVYSQLEERLRIKVYLLEEGRYERIYLSDITEFKRNEDSREVIKLPAEPTKSLLVAIKNEDMAYETFVGNIKQYEKKVYEDLNEERNYRFVRFDYPEIDTRRVENTILRLGSRIRVIDEIDVIKAVCVKQSLSEKKALAENGSVIKGWILEQIGSMMK